MTTSSCPHMDPLKTIWGKKSLRHIHSMFKSWPWEATLWDHRTRTCTCPTSGRPVYEVTCPQLGTPTAQKPRRSLRWAVSTSGPEQHSYSFLETDSIRAGSHFLILGTGLLIQTGRFSMLSPSKAIHCDVKLPAPDSFFFFPLIFSICYFLDTGFWINSVDLFA